MESPRRVGREVPVGVAVQSFAHSVGFSDWCTRGCVNSPLTLTLSLLVGWCFSWRLCPCSLNPKALEDILEHDEFSLIETDVMRMECGIKKQTIVDFCDAGTLSITASLVTSVVEKRRLYAAASRAYDNVRRRLPHCPVAQDNYATAVFNHALLENRVPIRQKLLRSCNRVYEELVKSRHPWLRTRSVWRVPPS
jgi:hypothetical protein